MTILPNLGKTVSLSNEFSLPLRSTTNGAAHPGWKSVCLTSSTSSNFSFHRLSNSPAASRLQSINGVGSFKGFSRLILELLQLAATRRVRLSGAAGVQFFHSSQTSASMPKRPYRLQQLLSHPAVYRAATKAEVIQYCPRHHRSRPLQRYRAFMHRPPPQYRTWSLRLQCPQRMSPTRRPWPARSRRHRLVSPHDSQNYAA